MCVFPSPTGLRFGSGIAGRRIHRQEESGPLSDGYAKFVADGVVTGGRVEGAVGFHLQIPIWGFPKIVVPQNGWFFMENPIKMGD